MTPVPVVSRTAPEPTIMVAVVLVPLVMEPNEVEPPPPPPVQRSLPPVSRAHQPKPALQYMISPTVGVGGGITSLHVACSGPGRPMPPGKTCCWPSSMWMAFEVSAAHETDARRRRARTYRT